MGWMDKTAVINHLSIIRDPSGKLNFAGKAIIHADGVDFSNGNSFAIKMADLELQEELGKGQYGTVQKVWIDWWWEPCVRTCVLGGRMEARVV